MAILNTPGDLSVAPGVSIQPGVRFWTKPIRESNTGNILVVNSIDLWEAAHLILRDKCHSNVYSPKEKINRNKHLFVELKLENKQKFVEVVPYTEWPRDDSQSTASERKNTHDTEWEDKEQNLQFSGECVENRNSVMKEDDVRGSLNGLL